LSLLARASRLDPLDVRQALTKTYSYRGELAPALSPRWFFVVAGEHVNQSASGTGASSSLLNLSYTIWSVGVRWAPTAPQR
jgi:hypothetical protein